MIFFENEDEYALRKIWFDFNGKRYIGTGKLKWQLDDGFQIDIYRKIDKKGSIEILKSNRSVGIIPNYSLKMELAQYKFAIAPSVPITKMHLFSLLNEGKLTLHARNIIFFDRPINIDLTGFYNGEAVLVFQNSPDMPEIVEKIIVINGVNVGKSSEHRGIFYEYDSDQYFYGYMNGKNLFNLYWRFSSKNWSKYEAWQFPVAFTEAVSIIYGQTVGLIKRELQNKYHELIKRKKVTSLGIFSPIHQEYQFDNEKIKRITHFFLENSLEAKICKSIFHQMVTAFKQKDIYAWQLLISTILEAILSTLKNRNNPPNVKPKKANVQNDLPKFCNYYFKNDWKKDWSELCKNDIYGVFKKMRHSSAHPHWDYNKDKIEYNKILKNIIFLSHFYGYMILAMAGFKDIEPKF